MILLILIFLFILVADASLDWYKIEIRNEPVNHFADSIAVALAYGAVAWVASLYMPWRQILYVLIAWPAVRWLLHDLLLNLFRNKPYDYLGSHSILDKLLTRIKISQFALKAIFLILSFGTILILEL